MTRDDPQSGWIVTYIASKELTQAEEQRIQITENSDNGEFG